MDNLSIVEYSLNWPGGMMGSTHELVISEEFIFVSGQNMHRIAKFNHQGELLQYYMMPEGSGPHGLLIDKKGKLWVSLEFTGFVVQLDENGQIVQEVDVKLHASGATPINTAPHGIGLDADGSTIWFTGKRTSTIGKIDVNKQVTHFQLDTLAALPIFLSAGPDGRIWGTELFGNSILNISAAGLVREFKIPTSNSRPIAIIPDPLAPYMWFTEEAGQNIGKIDMDGNITEYPVPVLQKNDILASLTFDLEGNLWVQVYVDLNNSFPAGNDYLIRFDKSIRTLPDADLSGISFNTYKVPGKMTMMHRIRTDAAGNIWFTEMMTDKLGKLSFRAPLFLH
ncbi:hypothetical protein ACEN2P_01965 [Pedobacter psychrotolerans]|uniref:Vgb family protein n=1 Tax=Pedobacter psychrotolerans TaxID=1843235 RepID=UPI003F992459